MRQIRREIYSVLDDEPSRGFNGYWRGFTFSNRDAFWNLMTIGKQLITSLLANTDYGKYKKRNSNEPENRVSPEF